MNLREVTGTTNRYADTSYDSAGTRSTAAIRSLLAVAPVIMASGSHASLNYSLDHLGSPRYITNASGGFVAQQNFDPFGAGGLFGSGALQFTGHERDQARP